MVDEIIKTDESGKPLEVRQAKGIQEIRVVEDVVIVYYVDSKYILNTITIPKSEFSKERLEEEINKIEQRYQEEEKIKKELGLL